MGQSSGASRPLGARAFLGPVRAPGLVANALRAKRHPGELYRCGVRFGVSVAGQWPNCRAGANGCNPRHKRQQWSPPSGDPLGPLPAGFAGKGASVEPFGQSPQFGSWLPGCSLPGCFSLRSGKPGGKSGPLAAVHSRQAVGGDLSPGAGEGSRPGCSAWSSSSCCTPSGAMPLSSLCGACRPGEAVRCGSIPGSASGLPLAWLPAPRAGRVRARNGRFLASGSVCVAMVGWRPCVGGTRPP